MLLNCGVGEDSRVPWTARRSNQSILKEIRISLEGMMLKLKLQYFGHFIWIVDSLKRLWCWEGLGAGGEGDDRGWDGWMASLTRWTWVWVNSGSWWWTGSPGVLRFMGSQRVGQDWVNELTDWLKTWPQNLAPHHFHHILFSKQSKGPQIQTAGLGLGNGHRHSISPWEDCQGIYVIFTVL